MKYYSLYLSYNVLGRLLRMNTIVILTLLQDAPDSFETLTLPNASN